MFYGKWLSVGSGFISAAIVAALMWYLSTVTPSGAAQSSGPDATVVITTSVAVGLALALTHWVYFNRQDLEMRRLIAYTELLGRASAPGPAPGPASGRSVAQAGTDQAEEAGTTNAVRRAHQSTADLAPITDAVERSVGELRRRMDDMIGQRRELEVQVRVADGQRRHIQAVLESIADAVIVTDVFNELVLANEAAAAMFGFELDSAMHQPVERVIEDAALVNLIKDTRQGPTEGPTEGPGDQGRGSKQDGERFGLRGPMASRDLGQGSRALANRRNVEHTFNLHGQCSIYNVTLACLPPGAWGEAGGWGDADPDTTASQGVVTVLRDITTEKQISEMKSDFVSNVSHELRTPLSSIKAYMEMLVDGEAPDDQTRAEFYNIIQSEANRLSRLIDNILNINRIESGVVKVQRESVSLYALIKEAVDVMQPQARAKNIRLVFSAAPSLIAIFADKDLIYQATLNLISNAIKYTGAEGRVMVSIVEDQACKQVAVAVQDTGVGISDDDLPRVFDKFFRVQDHKHMAKGTGLGLNLVSRIIETVHGGELDVTSKVGAGSTFTFTLPLANHGF